MEMKPTRSAIAGPEPGLMRREPPSAPGTGRLPAGREALRRLRTSVEFETAMLQSLVEPMLPKITPAAFGGRTSGDVWRSMLARSLAEIMSRHGGLGLAQPVSRNLEAKSTMPAGSALPGEADGAVGGDPVVEH
jgi:Rod binding domain-containing protein